MNIVWVIMNMHLACYGRNYEEEKFGRMIFAKIIDDPSKKIS